MLVQSSSLARNEAVSSAPFPDFARLFFGFVRSFRTRAFFSWFIPISGLGFAFYVDGGDLLIHRRDLFSDFGDRQRRLLKSNARTSPFSSTKIKTALAAV
jgi:hypothetical protein